MMPSCRVSARRTTDRLFSTGMKGMDGDEGDKKEMG